MATPYTALRIPVGIISYHLEIRSEDFVTSILPKLTVFVVPVLTYRKKMQFDEIPHCLPERPKFFPF